MAQTLKVLPVGRALVHDFEALAGGVLRFVGRSHDPEAGPLGGFVPREEPTEVPIRAEYLSALKHGDLEPADEDTARAAGLKWAPKPKTAPEVVETAAPADHA